MTSATKWKKLVDRQRASIWNVNSISFWVISWDGKTNSAIIKIPSCSKVISENSALSKDRLESIRAIKW